MTLFPNYENLLPYVNEFVGAYESFSLEAKRRIAQRLIDTASGKRNHQVSVSEYFAMDTPIRQVLERSAQEHQPFGIAILLCLNVILWEWRSHAENVIYRVLARFQIKDLGALSTRSALETLLWLLYTGANGAKLQQVDSLYLVSRRLFIEKRLAPLHRQRLSYTLAQFLHGEEVQGLPAPWTPDQFRVQVFQDLRLQLNTHR